MCKIDEWDRSSHLFDLREHANCHESRATVSPTYPHPYNNVRRTSRAQVCVRCQTEWMAEWMARLFHISEWHDVGLSDSLHEINAQLGGFVRLSVQNSDVTIPVFKRNLLQGSNTENCRANLIFLRSCPKKSLIKIKLKTYKENANFYYCNFSTKHSSVRLYLTKSSSLRLRTSVLLVLLIALWATCLQL